MPTRAPTLSSGAAPATGNAAVAVTQAVTRPPPPVAGGEPQDEVKNEVKNEVNIEVDGCCPISRQPLRELAPHERYLASDGHGYAREALADYLAFEAGRGGPEPLSAVTRSSLAPDVPRLFARPWPDPSAARARASRQTCRRLLQVVSRAMLSGVGADVTQRAAFSMLRNAVPRDSRGYTLVNGIGAAWPLVLAFNAAPLPWHLVPGQEATRDVVYSAVAAYACFGLAWQRGVGDTPAWLAAGGHHATLPALLGAVVGAVVYLLAVALAPRPSAGHVTSHDAFAASYLPAVPDLPSAPPPDAPLSPPAEIAGDPVVVAGLRRRSAAFAPHTESRPATS